MSWSAALGFAWIIAVSAVALIPYPRHRPYAIALLVLFPALLVLVALEHGPLWALAFLAAALSIYRYPARYLLRQAVHRLRGPR
ncbi:DUF2484 family protein [Rhodobacteraceae bacterium 2CG4]|uniref:DUF2484 family protein n=1 Tax=Halovulum marinum TaxID=2662447 RepID=A0A6L5Z238_9RHOB|nr:DUF2484 family protein [Halovulum marinum]MSU90568.1 DUF2484 family protein [Halovulum marinum]